MRSLRQGEYIGMVKPDLRRDASILPVLNTLDAEAGAKAGGQLRGTAQALYQVFIGHGHTGVGLYGHIKHYV